MTAAEGPWYPVAHVSPEAPTPRPPRPVRVLSDALVDQIAAGEVVERPASVVKELVENAVDAGARRVRVEIREGGAALVAVADDGVGMAPEDARLALARHATSKLGSAEDLARIGTFGFRGEALPAIASVSRLRLRTRTAEASEAFELRVEGGRLVEARSAPGPPGTRVEVTELFGNVPARRKFLKTEATEWGHVADWLARAALALPDIHFDVQRNDRPAVAWPAVKSPLDRVAAVLSEREAEALVVVEAVAGAARLHGFASRPDRHRPNTAGIHLFVNQRPVRDRLLRHALLEAYRDVLPRGRFPTALLFLALPPAAVDVNVHPAKWEVRFAEPGAVHKLVSDAVRQALGRRQWLGGRGPEPGRSPGPAPPGRVGEATPGDWALAGAPAPAATAAEKGTEGRPLRFAELRPLGQLLATYLLLEGPEGLLLLDQHAAHERVLFEGLRAAWGRGGVGRQPLLVPETLELSPGEASRLAEAADALERLGFEVEPFGASAVVVRALPALLAGRDPVGLVRGLADQLAASPEGGLGVEAADRIFASLACHAARRKGDRLAPDEQRALLAALDGIPWSPTCPHGRPVAVPLGLAEIERRFGRR